MKAIYGFVVILGYLIGSFPTALVVSRKMAGKDIREMGDGNMGARNTTHVLGWKAGILVAIVDFGKGALVIMVSKKLHIPLVWQFAAGVFAVLGHDFPVFAHFRGGQGMAAALGTMSILFTKSTMTGLLVFGLVYLLLRNFNWSAGLGLGSLVFFLWVDQRPHTFIIYAILLFLTIPAKKFWDAKHPYKNKVFVNL